MDETMLGLEADFVDKFIATPMQFRAIFSDFHLES